MPLPAERVITGRYVNTVTGEPYDGTGGSDYIVFEPVPSRWIDQKNGQILLGSARVNLSVDGSFAQSVVCTNADGVLPAKNRFWRLRQYVGGTWGEPQYFEVPMGDGPLDISDMQPVNPCN